MPSARAPLLVPAAWYPANALPPRPQNTHPYALSDQLPYPHADVPARYANTHRAAPVCGAAATAWDAWSTYITKHRAESAAEPKTKAEVSFSK